jgi:hypothetical protein
MKRIIRENTLSTSQHYEFEGTDEQRTEEAWEVTCGYLGDKQKNKLEEIRREVNQTDAQEQIGNIVNMAMLSLGISGYFPHRAITEFFFGKRDFS